jgi:hypothetical protein
MLAFVRAGDRVLVPPAAFGEYARAAMLAGALAGAAGDDAAEGRPDVPIDRLAAAFARAVRARAPRVAVVCTPESPAGRAWPLDAVREVAEACRRAGTLLVLDQSFDAFAPTPLGTPALPEHPATLHLRSLTKDHALAGVRVGYLVGPRRSSRPSSGRASRGPRRRPPRPPPWPRARPTRWRTCARRRRGCAPTRPGCARPAARSARPRSRRTCITSSSTSATRRPSPRCCAGGTR